MAKSPCDSYPRVLEGILSEEEVEHFVDLYRKLAESEWLKREKVAAAEGKKPPPRVLEYFTILRYIQSQEDARLDAIIQKIHNKVEKCFGPGFVIVQDFWSWRAAGSVAAGRIHVDGDFWMTSAHDGFNLWILLDHREMAYGFNIFTKEDNPDLYKLVAPERVTSILPIQEAKPGMIFSEPIRLWPGVFEWGAWRSLGQNLGCILCIVSTKWFQQIINFAQRASVLPAPAFRLLISLTGWLGNLSLLPKGLELRTRKFPLQVGDALVVRQDELHVSDQEPVKDHQFRLAVGFKFMRQNQKVTQYVFTGPASKARRRFPSLRLPYGKALPDLYRMKGVDMRQEETWLQRCLNFSSLRLSS
ncbi:unnamed protein product [Effrenium voratum]|nr:unnamed protein product [Effrenium voratum]